MRLLVGRTMVPVDHQLPVTAPCACHDDLSLLREDYRVSSSLEEKWGISEH